MSVGIAHRNFSKVQHNIELTNGRHLFQMEWDIFSGDGKGIFNCFKVVNLAKLRGFPECSAIGWWRRCNRHATYDTAEGIKTKRELRCYGSESLTHIGSVVDKPRKNAVACDDWRCALHKPFTFVYFQWLTKISFAVLFSIFLFFIFGSFETDQIIDFPVGFDQNCDIVLSSEETFYV